MLRKILVGVGSVVFLLLGFMGTEAEELGKEPFLYTQDFEEVDPVEFWATDGKYTVNFKGLTEEKSFSGKKSFKLDVTFEKGSYFCWSIPIRVPAEGKLKFSGRILLGEESTRTAGLGANVSFRPYESGCGPFASYGPTKGEWKLIEGDLVGYGKRIAGGAIPKYVWGAKGENVGVYADRIGLFLRGGKGQRVVVYVDDIKIEGEVPTEKAYREEIKKRRASAREGFDQKMSSWEEALALAEKELNALVNLSPEAENMRKAVEEKITSLKKKVEETRKRGYINPRDVEKIDPSLEQLKNMINIIC